MALTTALEKLVASRVQLQKENPFFSYLVLHLEFVETKDVDVAGVDGQGHLFYNKDYIEQKLTLEQCKGLLSHEVLHLVFEHNLRVGERDHLIYNIAGDCVINNILINNDFQLPPEGIKPNFKGENAVKIEGVCTIKNLDKKVAEEVYDELIKKAKTLKGQNIIIEIDFTNDSDSAKGDGDGEGNGNEKSKAKTKKSENPIDKAAGELRGKLEKERQKAIADGKEPADAKVSSDGLGKVTIELPEKDWKKIFTEAGIFARQRGNIPAGLERYFDNIYGEQLNWRELLQRYLVSSVPYDYTYTRPHKKSVSTGFYMPNILKENVEVVVSVDTSGSIDKGTLSDFFAEIFGVLNSFPSVKIYLLVHDAAVLDAYEVSSAEELKTIKVRGGGGTSHVPVYKYIRENYPNAELLVSLTDGYSDFPKTEEVRTIFVITKNGQDAPFGENIRIQYRGGTR